MTKQQRKTARRKARQAEAFAKFTRAHVKGGSVRARFGDLVRFPQMLPEVAKQKLVEEYGR